MYQQQQPYNPYAGLFGIIGTIMGMNAAKRNEAGIASALGSIGQQQPQQSAPVEVPQTPTNAPVPIQSQNVQQQMQGLLPYGSRPGYGVIPAQSQGLEPPTMPKQLSMQDRTANIVLDQQGNFQQPVTSAGLDFTQGSADPQVQVQQPSPQPQQAESAPAPKSTQAPIKTDIQKTYAQQGKQAIMELTSKRGMSYREAQKAVDDIVKQKTEEDFNTRANEYADQLNSRLDDVIGLDFSSNANKSKALGVISQINRGMQKIGRPGVDMGLMKELMNVNDLKIDKVNTGDGIQYVGYNSDGSKVVPIGSKIMVNKPSMTEYQRQTLNLRQQQLEGKEPKKPEWEIQHSKYESGEGMKDAQLLNEYQSKTQEESFIKPEDQQKYNVATARINQYTSQPNITADEQKFLSTLDRRTTTKEQAMQHLRQYRINKLNGIRQ